MEALQALLEQTRKELEEERVKKEQAEKKAELAEKKAEEERIQKELAEKKAEEEREQKELAEKQVQEDKLRRQEEFAKTHISGRNDLKRPLPDYRDTNQPPSITRGTHLITHLPKLVTKWTEFDNRVDTILQLAADTMIKVTPDIQHMKTIIPYTESYVERFILFILLYTNDFLHWTNVLDQSIDISVGPEIDKPTGENLPSKNGIPDLIFRLNNIPLFIVEVKHFTKIFHSKLDRNMHPADVYQLSSEEDKGVTNLQETLLHTHFYMVGKGELVYGIFSNYDEWCFIQRYVTEETGEEGVQLSRLYSRVGMDAHDSARMAIAYFIYLAVTSSIKTLKPGKMDPITPPLLVHPPEEEEEECPDKDDLKDEDYYIDESPERSNKKNKKNYGRKVAPFFSVGTIVDGFEFTTTSKMLPNINTLTLDAPESIIISSSDKATTFHGHIGERHLVWRQIDVYGLPKHFSDFPLNVLQEMVTNEIKAYHHLRPYWGSLVPHFVYFGQDINMLWVFVTTYEGISLKTWSQQNGGISREIKEKARNKLIQFHEHGVLHGDVVLRNVLYRESDQEILWIDFEFAQIFTDLKNPEFIHATRRELHSFDSELSSFPDLVQDSCITKQPLKKSRNETGGRKRKVYCC